MAKDQRSRHILGVTNPPRSHPTDEVEGCVKRISLISCSMRLPRSFIKAMADCLTAAKLRTVLNGWKPNCSMNYEYVFAWDPDLDISAIEIDWKHRS